MCNKMEFRRNKNAENYLRIRRRMGIIIPADMHAYRCPTCGWWNIGHKSKYDQKQQGLTT